MYKIKLKKEIFKTKFLLKRVNIMKKSDFYIRYKNSFHKVTGYIETIKNPQNKTIMIGFHKVSPNMWWVATHIESGLLLCHANTRKECLEKVKNTEFLERLNNDIERSNVKEYIEQMHKFLKTGSID